MNSKSIQLQLAESIQLEFKESVIKKVDKDNFVDIYLPSINNSKGTHLFFNTANSQIKLGFYVRETNFIDKVLSKSLNNLESYSQGLRLKGNPKFSTVDQATSAAKDFLQLINLSLKSSKTTPTDHQTSNDVSTKTLKVQADSDNLDTNKIISPKTPPKTQNKTKLKTIKQEDDSEFTKALSQLMDLPTTHQPAAPKVIKVKKTSKTKPSQVKLKKAITSIRNSSPVSPSRNKTKINWFQSLIEFIGNLFKK